MKDKNLAGILALFLGAFGIHRFYLGQVGLGILYVMFFYFSWIFALIDAIVFFSMDEDYFDRKYNKKEFRKNKYKERNRNRSYREEERLRRRREQQKRAEQVKRSRQPIERQTYKERNVSNKYNPYKQTGIKKFREFDYSGAIEDFEKALSYNPGDIAVHFNLACAYSLSEDAEKSLHHLSKAVENGFNDFEKIKSHEALAFVRVRKEFETFEANGFRLEPENLAIEEGENEGGLLNTEVPRSDDLLQQLKKLGELREKGLLSQEEFEKQKKKLLRRRD